MAKITKRQQSLAGKIDRMKNYPLGEALALVKEVAVAKFDESIDVAVNLGVDQFDCVMQTRIGRHGTALTSTGKLNITRSEFVTSQDPIDSACTCSVCARHTRGYIRHLFQVNEPTAARLVSLHNVAFTLNLMAQMQASIAQGNFAEFRKTVLATWASPASDKP